MISHAKPTVLVLFGGQSSEHQISCATAAGVLEVIDRQKWNVLPVGISPEGTWVLQPDDPAKYHLGKEGGYVVKAEGNTHVTFTSGSPLLLAYECDESEQIGHDTLRVLDSVDVVMPLLHGPFGEDGRLQGLLELAKVRYVGCGVESSAISMDKNLTKTVLKAAGIEVGRWVSVTSSQWKTDPQGVLKKVEQLGLPAFVKPARAGSSMGITQVHDWMQMAQAIEEAQKHDPRVIVEAATPGRELECGVLQMPGGEMVVSRLGEISVTGADFYDYKTKYFSAEDVSLTCPADVDPAIEKQAQETALKVFEALGCEGLARVDFFYNPTTGTLTVNEVNTLPGFTPFSMYPRLIGDAGVDYKTLIDMLLMQAAQRPLGLR